MKTYWRGSTSMFKVRESNFSQFLKFSARNREVLLHTLTLERLLSWLISQWRTLSLTFLLCTLMKTIRKQSMRMTWQSKLKTQRQWLHSLTFRNGSSHLASFKVVTISLKSSTTAFQDSQSQFRCSRKIAMYWQASNSKRFWEKKFRKWPSTTSIF